MSNNINTLNNREWRKNHPGYDKEWRERNLEKYRAYNREYQRQWRIKNPERFKARTDRDYKKNSDKFKHHATIRRARKKDAVGSHTRKEWMGKVSAHNWLCFYCKTPLTKKNLVKEHMTPLSRKGTNDIGNLVPSCPSCNNRKHTRTHDEYLLLVSVTA